MIAPSFDIIVGQCAIAAWFIVFAIGVLIPNRHLQVRDDGVFKRLGAWSLVLGLPMAMIFTSSAYLLKFIVMLVLSICTTVVGLKKGSRWHAWLGLVAAFLAYAAVGFQYVVIEMAR